MARGPGATSRRSGKPLWFNDRVRRHLTPSMAVALIALFVALGGVSYAAVELPRDSVGASQLKRSAVTSAKVKDGSLLARDFKAGQLPRGEQGPAGERGATGATGPTFSFADGTVFGVTIPITSATTVVSKEVALPFAGRLVVVFTGRVFIFGGNAASDSAIAVCSAWSRPSGGAWARESQVIPSSQAVNGAFDDGAVTLTFAVDAATAGTYEIAIRCSKEEVSGTPNLGFDRYDMTGVLTAS